MSDPFDAIKQCRLEVDDLLQELQHKIDNKYLTSDQIQHIADIAAEKAAERAADLVMEKAYTTIGRSVLSSVFRYVGIFVLALAVLLHEHWIPIK
jgi:hypothetical protein